MAALTLHDLPEHRDLDQKAMATVRGGGASWVFGWIRPYVPGQHAGAAPTFVQINNYYADQMINQFQVVDINNTGAASLINVDLGQQSQNMKPPFPGTSG